MTTRKEILEMLSAGEITVDEATELLAAQKSRPVEEALPDIPVPQMDESKAAPPKRRNGRWLRIEVSNLATGKSRVRVNVPLGLVELGTKFVSRFTNELDSDVLRHVNEAIKDPDLDGTIVEVEDAEDNERVHIYIA